MNRTVSYNNSNLKMWAYSYGLHLLDIGTAKMLVTLGRFHRFVVGLPFLVLLNFMLAFRFQWQLVVSP